MNGTEILSEKVRFSPEELEFLDRLGVSLSLNESHEQVADESPVTGANENDHRKESLLGAQMKAAALIGVLAVEATPADLAGDIGKAISLGIAHMIQNFFSALFGSKPHSRNQQFGMTKKQIKSHNNASPMKKFFDDIGL